MTASRSDREARLADALRRNLHRRKAQARARDAESASPAPTPDDDGSIPGGGDRAD